MAVNLNYILLNNKKGLSPIIATVLLVGFVIVAIGIIFIWARTVVREPIEKFSEPISRACDNIDLSVSIEGDKLTISNNGDKVPVYNINLVINDNGDKNTQALPTPIELSPGQSKNVDVSSYDTSKIVAITPILKGTKGRQGTEYSCDRKEFELNQ